MFINKYTITFEKYLDWLKYLRSRGIALISMLISLIIGSCSLFVGAFALYLYFTGKADFSFNSIVSICLGILLLYSALLRTYLNARQKFKAFQKTYNTSEWDVTYTFDESSFTVTELKSNTAFDYSNIEKVRENSTCFVLYITTRAILFVYKNSFTVGDEASFRDFINNKVNSPAATKIN